MWSPASRTLSARGGTLAMRVTSIWLASPLYRLSVASGYCWVRWSQAAQALANASVQYTWVMVLEPSMFSRS